MVVDEAEHQFKIQRQSPRAQTSCVGWSKIIRGRKAEIEAWVEYQEIFCRGLLCSMIGFLGRSSRTLGKKPQYRTPDCRR